MTSGSLSHLTQRSEASIGFKLRNAKRFSAAPDDLAACYRGVSLPASAKSFPHDSAIEFAALVFLNFVHHKPAFWNCLAVYSCPAPLPQRIDAYMLSGHQTDGRSNDFATCRIINPKHAGLRDRWMTFDQSVDLCRLYFMSSPVDFVFEPASQSHGTIFADKSEISGAVPAIDKC
jgi:hypothetical protein